jgi:hypothetical protein
VDWGSVGSSNSPRIVAVCRVRLVRCSNFYFFLKKKNVLFRIR